MATATSYPHIVTEPSTPARLESHPRTRVAMIVMDDLARGLGPEEIVRHYPYLKLAEVHSAFVHYPDHADEIDAAIQAELEQIERDPDANTRSPIGLNLKRNGVN
jgi:hypothetical protein